MSAKQDAFAMLAAYLAAEAAVRQGHEVQVDGHTFRPGGIAEVRKGRAKWEAMVATELADGTRIQAIGRVGRFKMEGGRS